MTELERGLRTFKSDLPAKCKKEGFPHILWILAPYHKNFENNDQRYKFNRAVEDACKFHCNASALELKKVWNSEDEGLFSTRRYTSDATNATGKQLTRQFAIVIQ